MSSYQAEIESMVFGILRALPKSELLYCTDAYEIAATLVLGAPESYSVVSKVGDFCKQEDIALLTIVLPDITSDLVHWDGSGKLDVRDAANKATAILKVLNQHPKYVKYRSDLKSLSSEQTRELALGFHQLQTTDEQNKFVRRNPKTLSSPVDFLLAMSAHAAHGDKAYNVENKFMQTRARLVQIKEHG